MHGESVCSDKVQEPAIIQDLPVCICKCVCIWLMERATKTQDVPRNYWNHRSRGSPRGALTGPLGHSCFHFTNSENCKCWTLKSCKTRLVAIVQFNHVGCMSFTSCSCFSQRHGVLFSAHLLYFDDTLKLQAVIWGVCASLRYTCAS